MAAAWSVAEVGAWLAQAGHGDLASVFEANDIDGELLLQLDHELLKEMGVTSVGRRMKLLKLTQELPAKPDEPAPGLKPPETRAEAPPADGDTGQPLPAALALALLDEELAQFQQKHAAPAAPAAAAEPSQSSQPLQPSQAQPTEGPPQRPPRPSRSLYMVKAMAVAELLPGSSLSLKGPLPSTAAQLGEHHQQPQHDQQQPHHNDQLDASASSSDRDSPAAGARGMRLLNGKVLPPPPTAPPLVKAPASAPPPASDAPLPRKGSASEPIFSDHDGEDDSDNSDTEDALSPPSTSASLSPSASATTPIAALAAAGSAAAPSSLVVSEDNRPVIVTALRDVRPTPERPDLDIRKDDLFVVLDMKGVGDVREWRVKPFGKRGNVLSVPRDYLQIDSSVFTRIQQQYGQKVFMDTDHKGGKKGTVFKKNVIAVPAKSHSNPVATGWLYKIGATPLSKAVWRRRWCVLQDYVLYYYKSPEDQVAQGKVPLPGYIVSLAPDDVPLAPRKFMFKVMHPNSRTYVFAAETKEDMDRFMYAINLSTVLELPSAGDDRQR